MSGKVHPDKMTKKELRREVRKTRQEEERRSNISERYPEGWSGVHPCVNSCTKCGCTAATCGCGIAAACGSGCSVMGGRRTRRRKRKRRRKSTKKKRRRKRTKKKRRRKRRRSRR
tara:strand:- start:396 stop:740 length:345 start_codon:yes stop_codon:yes gene_type:complete